MEKTLAQKYYKDWSERRNDLPILIKIAEASSDLSSFVLEHTLNPINEKLNNESSTNTKDVVTLSTIHSAKGLEAHTCYVLNVSPGAYPNKWSSIEGYDAIEEERRCLYVALTRAKDRLIILRNESSFLSKNKSTNHFTRQRSKFLLNAKCHLKTNNGMTAIITKVDDKSDDLILHLNYTLYKKEVKLTEKEFYSMYNLDIPQENIDYILEKHQIENTESYFFNSLPRYLVKIEAEHSGSKYKYNDEDQDSIDIDLDYFDFS